MLNNKGQSLVLFVLLMPIFVMIMVTVIDVGNLISAKTEIDNINKIVIDYGLDNMNDINVVNDMKLLAKENKKDINIDIKFVDMEYRVLCNYYVDGIFSNVLKIKGYNVKSSYIGYLDNNKKIIKKIK